MKIGLRFARNSILRARAKINFHQNRRGIISQEIKPSPCMLLSRFHGSFNPKKAIVKQRPSPSAFFRVSSISNRQQQTNSSAVITERIIITPIFIYSASCHETKQARIMSMQSNPPMKPASLLQSNFSPCHGGRARVVCN